ncbi:MAG: hypothetical protein KDB27_33530 [Planctomycetales bacterium]|nr:hypothetical protein [Planctomycetales bacterium]
MLKTQWRCSFRDDVDPSTLAAILADHQHYRHRLAKRRGKPFTGAYYWVPDASGGWELSVWPDAFYEGGEAGHVDVWKDLVYILAYELRIEPTELHQKIGNCPYGLPRGRVVKMGDGSCGVAHGNDHPMGCDLKSAVEEAFCLAGMSPVYFLDEHEQMLLRDQVSVQSSLGLH